MQIIEKKMVRQKVEIGEIDHKLRLPTEGRKRHGMKTICDACGKPIEDDFFTGGFKAGRSNMMFHETCV